MSKRVIAGLLTACLMFQSIFLEGFAAPGSQEQYAQNVTVTEVNETVAETEEASTVEGTSVIEEASTSEETSTAVVEEESAVETETVTEAVADVPENLDNHVQSVLPIEDSTDENGEFVNFNIDFLYEKAQLITGTFVDGVTGSTDVTFELYEYAESTLEAAQSSNAPVCKTVISDTQYVLGEDIYTFSPTCNSEDGVIRLMEGTKFVKVVANIATTDGIVYVSSPYVKRDSFPSDQAVKLTLDKTQTKVSATTVSIPFKMEGIKETEGFDEKYVNIWTKADKSDEIQKDLVSFEDIDLFYMDEETGEGEILVNGLNPNTKYNVQLVLARTKENSTSGETEDIYRLKSNTLSVKTSANQEYLLSEVFPDESLQYVIKEELDNINNAGSGMSIQSAQSVLAGYGETGDADKISLAEMDAITALQENYDDVTSHEKIQSLKGLDRLYSLSMVSLTGQNITDTSDVKWSNLKKLQELNLQNSGLTKIPDLSGNSELYDLNLKNNNIPQSEFDSISGKLNNDTINCLRPSWNRWLEDTINSQNTIEFSAMTEDVFYGDSSKMPFFVKLNKSIGDHDDVTVEIDGGIPQLLQPYTDNYSNSIYYTFLSGITPSDDEHDITVSIVSGQTSNSTTVHTVFKEDSTSMIGGPVYKTEKSTDNFIPSIELLAKKQIASVSLVKDTYRLNGELSYSEDAVYDTRYRKLSPDGLNITDCGLTEYSFNFVKIDKVILSGNYDLEITYSDNTTETIPDALQCSDKPVIREAMAECGNDNLGDYLYLHLYGVNINPEDYNYTFSYGMNTLKADYQDFQYGYLGVIVRFKKGNWSGIRDGIRVMISSKDGVEPVTLPVRMIYPNDTGIYTCYQNTVKNTLVLGVTGDVEDGDGHIIISGDQDATEIFWEKDVTLENGVIECSPDYSDFWNGGSYYVTLRIHGKTYQRNFEYRVLNYNSVATGSWNNSGKAFPVGTGTTEFIYYSNTKLSGEYLAYLYNPNGYCEANIEVTGGTKSNGKYVYKVSFDLSELDPNGTVGSYRIVLLKEGETSSSLTGCSFYIMASDSFIITSSNFVLQFTSMENAYLNYYVRNCSMTDDFKVTLKDTEGNDVEGVTCSAKVVSMFSNGQGLLRINMDGWDLEKAKHTYSLSVQRKKADGSFEDPCALDGSSYFQNDVNEVRIDIGSLGGSLTNNCMSGVKVATFYLPAQLYIYDVISGEKKAQTEIKESDVVDGYFYFTQSFLKKLDKKAVYNIGLVDAKGAIASSSSTALTAYTKNPVTTIQVDKTASLTVGDKKRLIPTYKPVNANVNTTFTYSSSNTDVAEVDRYGTITAKSIGKAVITVTGGKVSARCQVTVSDMKIYTTTDVTAPTQDPDNRIDDILGIAANEGDGSQTIIVDGINSNSDVFISGDTSIATVTQLKTCKKAAVIKAVSLGETVIKVTADGITREFRLVVDKNRTFTGIELNSDHFDLVFDGAEPVLNYSFAVIGAYPCPFDADIASIEDMKLEAINDDGEVIVDSNALPVTIAKDINPDFVYLGQTQFRVIPKENYYGQYKLRYSVKINGTVYSKDIALNVTHKLSEDEKNNIISECTSELNNTSVIFKKGDVKTLANYPLHYSYVDGIVEWTVPTTKLKADNNAPVQYFEAVYTPIDEEIEEFRFMLPLKITQINGIKVNTLSKPILKCGCFMNDFMTYKVDYTGAEPVYSVNDFYDSSTTGLVITPQNADTTGNISLASSLDGYLGVSIQPDEDGHYTCINKKVKLGASIIYRGSEEEDSNRWATALEDTKSIEILGPDEALIYALNIEAAEKPEAVVDAAAVTNFEDFLGISIDQSPVDNSYYAMLEYRDMEGGNRLYLKANINNKINSDGDGAPVYETANLNDKFTITSSDTSIIKVMTSKAGGKKYSCLQVLKPGCTVLTFTAKDKSKKSFNYMITVYDGAPSLVDNEITINKKWVRTQNSLEVNHGDYIQSLRLLNADKKTENSDFIGEYNTQSTLSITLKEEAFSKYKKGKIVTLYPEYTVEDGKVYISAEPVKIRILDEVPKISVTNKTKANVFNMDTSAEYLITASENIAGNITYDTYSEEEDFGFDVYLDYISNEQRRITFSANEHLAGENAWKNYLSKDENGKKLRNCKIWVSFENFAPVPYDLTVATENKPITISATDAVAVEDSLYLTTILKNTKSKEKLNLAGAVCTFTNTKANAPTLCKRECDENCLLIESSSAFTKAMKYKLSVLLARTTQPVTTTFNVKKVAKPQLQIDTKTIVLNTGLPTGTEANSSYVVSVKEDATLMPADMSLRADKTSSALLTSGYLHYNFAENRLNLSLDGERPANIKTNKEYTFYLYGKACNGNREETETKPCRLTIQLTEKAPKAKASASGQINLVDRENTSVKYKLTVSETDHNPQSVSLSGKDADLFTADYSENTVIVKAKTGKPMKTKTKYSFNMDIRLDNGSVVTIPNVSITPIQKLPGVKITFSTSTTMNRQTGAGAFISFSVNEDFARILNPYSDKLLPNKYRNVFCIFSEYSLATGDQIIVLDERNAEAIKLKAGKYALQLQVDVKDGAINEKKPVITVNFNLK